ncbi:hypothetical protein [Mesorhizobium sp. CAU 1732]|uniref:hypothetical protein n=1 Tax=Mesorhizobium sp. CAU 1732 TaxID=3140358 RepID=UPI0032608A5B
MTEQTTAGADAPVTEAMPDLPPELLASIGEDAWLINAYRERNRALAATVHHQRAKIAELTNRMEAKSEPAPIQSKPARKRKEA